VLPAVGVGVTIVVEQCRTRFTLCRSWMTQSKSECYISPLCQCNELMHSSRVCPCECAGWVCVSCAVRGAAVTFCAGRRHPCMLHNKAYIKLDTTMCLRVCMPTPHPLRAHTPPVHMHSEVHQPSLRAVGRVCARRAYAGPVPRGGASRYLLFRGFTSTLRAFDAESRVEGDRGLRVDKIVEQLFSYVDKYEIDGECLATATATDHSTWPLCTTRAGCCVIATCAQPELATGDLLLDTAVYTW
jgi:hypothetical protein